jgi:hypothetical protein
MYNGPSQPTESTAPLAQDDLINRTFSQIPCLGCSDWHRDFCLARLGAFFLAHEAGQQPKLSRAELMKSCCKNEFPSVTFAKPKHYGKSSRLAWEKPDGIE